MISSTLRYFIAAHAPPDIKPLSMFSPLRTLPPTHFFKFAGPERMLLPISLTEPHAALMRPPRPGPSPFLNHLVGFQFLNFSLKPVQNSLKSILKLGWCFAHQSFVAWYLPETNSFAGTHVASTVTPPNFLISSKLGILALSFSPIS